MALLLTVLTAPAWALGLGQIEVKSRGGQPLLAEIPIISTDPQELYGLQAQLASPDTYSRIGLPFSQQLASELRFDLVVDEEGKPRIRITSQQPVQEPVVQFLVQVDWGQGRLVREYSALVDTPRTVQAPLQPPIEAPVAAPDNTIIQPPIGDAVAATDVQPSAEGEETAQAAQASEDGTEADGDTVAAAPAEPERRPLPPVLPDEDALRQVEYGSTAPAPTSGVAAAGDYRIQRGDTLSGIVDGLGLSASRNQAMVALLRANPQAFIDDNINLIKTGARLNIPSADSIAAIDSRDANQLVRQHVQAWRSAQAPLAQPTAVAGAATATAASAPNPASTPSPAAATASTGARLEIAPPSASAAQRAGSTSGMSAGGGGDMLRQELQTTQETLAARNAEVDELKARVAELEQLQQDQQRLIQMKDNELAAAQQRAASAAPDTATAAGLPVWLWIVPILLLAAIAALLLSRRRSSNAPAVTTAGTRGSPSWGTAEPPPGAKATDAQPASVPVADFEPVSSPAWQARGLSTAYAQPVSDSSAQRDPRLDKAHVCIDQGDLHGARGYLNDVLANADPVAQAEAARLLRDLT
ncbi:MAG: fimbrial protein FimV [Pseudoxanthomonas suwonensis]|nr:MAG: fimbrial protein FimV [Pseudoxanthomonas suwonensis]